MRSAFDDDHRVGDGRLAGAVDERPAFEHEHAVLRRRGGRTEHNGDERPANP